MGMGVLKIQQSRQSFSYYCVQICVVIVDNKVGNALKIKLRYCLA